MRTKENVREVVFPQLGGVHNASSPLGYGAGFGRPGHARGDCLTLVLSRWSNLVSHSYTTSPSSILIRGIQAVYDLPISTVVVL